MKIIITGSNGYVGYNLCRALYSAYDIIGVGIEENSSHSFLHSYYSIDITDDSKLKSLELLKYCSNIIHTAALITESEKIIDVNVKGSYNIANLAKSLNCNIIFLSSIPVIGLPKVLPIDENHVVLPQTLYHMTKYFAEQIFQLPKFNSVNTTILRIPSPVGINMPKDRVFSIFLQQAINNLDINIYGNGKRVQNFLDIRDLATAVNNAIANKSSGLFLIAGNEASNIELAKQCISLTNSKSNICFANDLTDSEDKWIISSEKARQYFDYAPQYNIGDMIKFILKEQYNIEKY